MASTSGATFSYAQAAKGLAPSTQTNSTIASSASSENGSKEISSESPVGQIRSKQLSPKPEVDQQSNVLAPTESDSNNFGSGNEEVAAKAQANDIKVTTSTTDAIDAPSVATSESGAVLSESDPVLISRGINSERSVKSPTSERSAATSEADKAKETDDDWEKVSVPSIAAEKELKAAPLPPVNIWLQRKEAQEAKVKEQGVPRAAVAPARQRSQVAASIDEGRRQSSTKEQSTDKDTSNAPRRFNSGGRTTQDRKDQNSAQVSPRSLSKQSEKTSTNSPPSTADPESWPTPDTTLTDERRRSSVLEKNDKVDAKSGTQKKSWIQMPFVPTAKFETQLPPAAAARRGGRPSNRGRDATGRGGITTTGANGGEKPEPGSMGPPPIPNKSGDNERGRKHEAPRNTRASSVPTQGRRAPSKDSNTSTSQRYTGPNPGEATDNNATASVTHSKTSETVVDENSAEVEVSRSSSRKASRQQSANRKATNEVRDVNQTSSHNATPSFDSNAQHVNHGDRQKVPYEGFRPYGDHADRGVPHGREWSRGRVDVSREKSDSWRGSRDSRPERGRGNYRGRGNHNAYTPHGSHTYTPPITQNGFDSSKPTPSQDGRSRQASQPFIQAPSAGNNRNNVRSQSIPLAIAQQNYYNSAPGYPPTLSSTEMNYTNYPHQMQGSIMSAMPYNDQLGSYALYSLIITQLDYYFSIDNLCKDMFLRKHMDSQGFVSVNVILGFKRIQAMTEGMTRDQLRTVCQQVRNVEFITGDDGEDRLRSRDNWRDFVLPMEERVPAAQNDGPAIRAPTYQSSSIAQSGFPSPDRSMRSPPHLNGYAEPFIQPMSPVSFNPNGSLNGANEYAVGRPDSQPFDQGRRSSAASPFSKVQSPSFEQVSGPSSYMTNGHRPSMSNNASTENVFPDEKIPELKVVVRDPAFEVSSPQANGSSTSNLSNLRGGASSPSQLDHFRPLQFGEANSSPSAIDIEQPPYWTKDGDLAKIPVGPGFVHEDYLALHDKAITQRMENHFDGALSVLYSFWSTFLVGNFNISMYKEFVELARDDLHDGNGNGKVHLLRYYDSLLASKIPMSERIAKDIVMMAREETGDRRPTFQKLRTAWRNGATNLKTRKRLGDVLTVEEKTEFDKSS